MSIAISPYLFAFAKVLDFAADTSFAGTPEQPLLHGISSILQVVTVYLLARGLITFFKKK